MCIENRRVFFYIKRTTNAPFDPSQNDCLILGVSFFHFYLRTNIWDIQFWGVGQSLWDGGGSTSQSKMAAIKMKDEFDLSTSSESVCRVWVGGRTVVGIALIVAVSEGGMIVCVGTNARLDTIQPGAVHRQACVLHIVFPPLHKHLGTHDNFLEMYSGRAHICEFITTQ